MANLDSRSKRASSVQILAPYLLSLVLPDGTIAQLDRQHTAWSYSGILATIAAASEVHEDRIFSIPSESRAWGIDSESRVYAVPSENRTGAVE